MRSKKIPSFVYGHFEHLSNGLPLPATLQCFAVVARSAAYITANIQVREKLHRHAHHPFTGTGFTSTAMIQERKAGGRIPAFPCGKRFGKKFTDRRECSRITCRIGARRPSNRSLINTYHLIKILSPIKFTEGQPCTRRLGVFGNHCLQSREQRIHDQC